MRNPWKLTTFALTALLVTAIGRNAMVSSADAEPQPKMREALQFLRSAVGALEAATPDKGGHRVKAIELARGAIGQVEEGIKFDNRH